VAVSDDPSLSAHAAHNRRTWDELSATYQSKHGPQMEESGGTAWGVWQLPEAELRILGDVRGKDVLELGCGAAQWSIALHAIGARVTGLDNSSVQLEHARTLMAQVGADFPLVHSSAEATPFDLAWAPGEDHPGERLALDYWSLHTVEEPGEPVAFQLPYGGWIGLFRDNGLAVEDLIELRPAADAASSFRDEHDLAWARRWPMEHIWRVRRAPTVDEG
jgi:SAM-dependent methyltransferase